MTSAYDKLKADMDADQADRDATHAAIDQFEGPKDFQTCVRLRALRGDAAALVSDYATAQRMRSEAREMLGVLYAIVRDAADDRAEVDRLIYGGAGLAPSPAPATREGRG